MGRSTGRKSAVLAALACAMVASLACGSAEPREGQHFVVSADEYRFEPAELRARAGAPITIELRNAGDMSHNLTFEGIGEGTPTIEPGDSAELLMELEEPGTYAFACTVTNHARTGLRGKLIVEEGSVASR